LVITYSHDNNKCTKDDQSATDQIDGLGQKQCFTY